MGDRTRSALRYRHVPWAWVARWTVIAVLTLPTALYIVTLPGAVGTLGRVGDWHALSLVNPLAPYDDNGFYRWAPLAAFLWRGVVLLGFWPWAALHMAALVALWDWRRALLVGLSWPFWWDWQNGSVIVFILLAAVWALRGSRVGVAAYVALCALMPRPLMLPVLAWLLWRHPDARWMFAAAAAAVLGSSLAVGQLGPWIGRLLASSSEMGSGFNLAPSAVVGPWWIVAGLPLAVWLTWRRRLGLASLAASPYWLPYYLLMGLVGTPSATAATRRS